MWCYSPLIRHEKQSHLTHVTHCEGWPGAHQQVRFRRPYGKNKWHTKGRNRSKTCQVLIEKVISTVSYITGNVFDASSRVTSHKCLMTEVFPFFFFLSFYQFVSSQLWSLTHRCNTRCLSCWNVHWPACSISFHLNHWAETRSKEWG